MPPFTPVDWNATQVLPPPPEPPLQNRIQGRAGQWLNWLLRLASVAGRHLAAIAMRIKAHRANRIKTTDPDTGPEDTMKITPVSIAFSTIAVIITTLATLSSYHGNFNFFLWTMTAISWFILWTLKE